MVYSCAYFEKADTSLDEAFLYWAAYRTLRVSDVINKNLPRGSLREHGARVRKDRPSEVADS